MVLVVTLSGSQPATQGTQVPLTQPPQQLREGDWRRSQRSSPRRSRDRRLLPPPSPAPDGAKDGARWRGGESPRYHTLLIAPGQAARPNAAISTGRTVGNGCFHLCEELRTKACFPWSQLVELRVADQQDQSAVPRVIPCPFRWSHAYPGRHDYAASD